MVSVRVVGRDPEQRGRLQLGQPYGVRDVPDAFVARVEPIALVVSGRVAIVHLEETLFDDVSEVFSGD